MGGNVCRLGLHWERIKVIADPSLILILSDINMPGMSGLEMLPKVRAERPNVPVIMITAGDRRRVDQFRASKVEIGIPTNVDTLAAIGAARRPPNFRRLRVSSKSILRHRWPILEGCRRRLFTGNSVPHIRCNPDRVRSRRP